MIESSKKGLFQDRWRKRVYKKILILYLYEGKKMPNWEMDVHLKEISRDVETCTCVKRGLLY